MARAISRTKSGLPPVTRCTVDTTVGVCGCCQQLFGDLGAIEGVQLKAFGGGEVAEVRRVAGGRQDEDRHVRELFGEVTQYQDGGFVSTVDVVEDDDQAAVAGGSSYRVGDFFEEQEAVVTGEHLIRVQAEGSQDLPPGPVGRRAIGLGAAAPGNGSALCERRSSEFLRQPGLADSCLAGTHHEAPAARARLVNPPPQRPQFPQAPHHRHAPSIAPGDPKRKPTQRWEMCSAR